MRAEAKSSGTLVTVLLRFFASKPGQRLFFKSVCKHSPTGDAASRMFETFSTSSAARHDVLRTTTSLEPSVTMDAVPALRASTNRCCEFDDSDKLFPLEHARRLQADFPNARLEIIPDASTYVMLYQPEALACALGPFSPRRPRKFRSEALFAPDELCPALREPTFRSSRGADPLR